MNQPTLEAPQAASSVPVAAALLGLLPYPTALWTAGAFVAGADLPVVVADALGEEARGAAAAFLAAPRAGELAVGGAGRPLLAIAWHNLGEGAWLASVREALPADPGAERRRTLVAALSHEAKTPLAVIRGYLELLRARTALGEQQRSYVVHVLEEVARLDALLDDWLHAASATSGRLPVRPALVDLGELARVAARSFGARHEGRHIVLEGAGPVPVRADAERIGEVLANLLDNAARHGPARVPIVVGWRAAKGEGVITVHNDGPGIAPDDLERLFEPFFRARGAAPGGSGLGLAVAEAIVRAHGGRIWAESGSDAGTTFAFALPLADPAEGGIR